MRSAQLRTSLIIETPPGAQLMKIHGHYSNIEGVYKDWLNTVVFYSELLVNLVFKEGFVNTCHI